jgi:dextranase
MTGLKDPVDTLESRGFSRKDFLAVSAAASAAPAASRLSSMIEVEAPGLSAMRLLDYYPARAYFHPGANAAIHVRVSKAAVARTSIELRLLRLDKVESIVRKHVTESEHVVEFPLPPVAGTGYGVQITLLHGKTAVDHGVTAIDVQHSWVDAPRYGFLSNFSPGQHYGSRAAQMLRRHINVVQFYDWMYRHYQYLPPEDTFTDVLGVTLSMVSVRHALAAVKSRGMAGMAYGSVYGAEPEYALKHKDELLYDSPGGTPISLAGLFYLQDVRPGPWRQHILGQYGQAIRGVGFNGIHADQYGFPTEAYDYKGNLVEMGPALAGIVGAAQKSVVADGGTGVIFNCVTNWPIQDVAPEPQLCMYIEVWPPFTQLLDLYALIKNARKLAPKRQVILAAYMSCAAGSTAAESYAHWENGWGISDASGPDAAETATLLTAASIHASGGFHLLLGEGTGMLADPYYPKFVRPSSKFQQRLVQHWDFIVRYTAYLFDRSLEYRSEDIIDSGGLWAIHRSGPEFDTLSLINAAPTDEWNIVKRQPATRRNVRVEMPGTSRVSAVYAANPDGGADAVRLDFTTSAGNLQFTVPSVRIWTLIVVIHD